MSNRTPFEEYWYAPKPWVEDGLGPDTTKAWAEEIFTAGRASMKAEALQCLRKCEHDYGCLCVDYAKDLEP